MFSRDGRLPTDGGLDADEWHDMPNPRFPSILDFEELCTPLDIRIEQAVYGDVMTGREVDDDRNLSADVAVLAVSGAAGAVD